MARTDHWVGLSPRARQIVAGASRRECGTVEGAFYNRFALFEYALRDGRLLREVIQADIWAGGPHYFTTLEEDGVRVESAEWTEQELADVMGFQVEDSLPSITDEDDAMFSELHDSIESGIVVLDWRQMDKYERWKAQEV